MGFFDFLKSGTSRRPFDMPSGDIQYEDPTRIGGGVGIEHQNGNAPSTYTMAPDETERYRGLGEAAAKRQAYQADFGKALGNEQQGVQARGAQLDAAAQMRNAAQGGAPSQAAILGNQAAGQSLQAQLAAGANARGLGQAAAQMQAAGGVGQQQLGAMGQYAGMRGAEMGRAQDAYGQASGTLRAGDYAQQGMAQQRAEAQGQSEATQRRLNQEAQMGYEQMGINNQQAQVDSDARNAAIRAQQNADATASHDARNARDLKLAVAGMSTLATLGSNSDERTKQGVRGQGDMGAALAQGFKPFEYEYKPGFREAEGQAPGEKNVGPMAQDMAKNTVTGSAVKQGPDGMLMVDIPKATKVNSAGIGYLAAKQRQMEDELARMKGGR